MTPMHWLWLGALALLLLSLALLLPPLLAEVTPAAPQRDETALRSLYQAQLAELERERQGGRLGEAEHAQAVEELQRRLLSELDRPRQATAWRQSPWLKRGSALALAMLLPVAAFALYLQVGDPKAVAQLAQQQDDVHGGQGGDAQVQAMVEGLARRLQEQPQDLPGWLMLARSYDTLERYADAARAYRQAVQEARRAGMDAQIQARLWADLADALASARGGDLDGEAGQAIARALQLRPDQAKALALAGTAAARRGELEQARQHWRALLALLEPGSDMALRVQDDLLRLESLQAGGAAPATGADARSEGVAGEVRLAPALRELRLTPQARVFVVVRAPDRPQPVAALRLPADALPARFALGEAHLLDPAISLSSPAALQIQARLSFSGQASVQAGDVYSPAVPLQAGAADVLLEIGAVSP